MPLMALPRASTVWGVLKSKCALDIVWSRACLSEHIKIGQLMALISAAIDNSSHLNFLSGVYCIFRFRSANTSEARWD